MEKILRWIKENWVVRYFNYLNTWREHRETIKVLNRMSDEQLKDIGMSRNDISRLIWLEDDKTMKGRGNAD
jgi:uncharacterized protein YjiS (DUF1127 family)